MSAFPAIPGAFDRPRSGEVDVLVVAGEHSGDQHAAQRVAQRMAIATLEGLQGHLGAVGRQLLHVDGFGFQQIGLHAGLPLNTPGSLHR